MEREISVSFDNLLQVVESSADIFQDQVIVVEIDGNQEFKRKGSDLLIRLDALAVLLVVKGEIVITVDYLPYRVTQHTILELTHKHLLNSIQLSHDAKGYYVVFARELLKELSHKLSTLPNEFIINKRFSPITKLDAKDFALMVTILQRLQHNIKEKEHFFHRGVVLNEVSNFIMEMTNIQIQRIKTIKTDYKTTHNEELALRFMHLVVSNGKEWNEVSQYSTELCVTPVYLSRAIKSVTGKTVMDWLNEARIAEAKILLRRHNISIQDVSEELRFSDQSAFGKFFKKHTGVSPLEYRKKMHAMN